jgi:5'-methylthioadenosine phosphorylase
MIAIIGGSGLTRLDNLEITRRQIVRTPYGEPSGPLTFGRIGSTELLFLARHGYAHTLAPHEVNYRANLWALQEQGAKRVLAVFTVGGIAEDLGAGSLVVPDQILDYTWGRPSTFFEGSEQPVTHIDWRGRRKAVAQSPASYSEQHEIAAIDRAAFRVAGSR